MKEPCIFCYEGEVGQRIKSGLIAPDEFEHWDLTLNLPSQRETGRRAAGYFILKQHLGINDIPDAAIIEAHRRRRDAARFLCEALALPFTDQLNINANDGPDAGQQQFHAHIHILPWIPGDMRGGHLAVLDAFTHETRRK